MTDLLTAAKQALEALSAAENHYDSAEKWRSHFAAKDALRQAIEQTERGTQAWADVPNATKWVDELRGNEPEPIGEIRLEHLDAPYKASQVVMHFYNELPPVGTKLFVEPPNSSTGLVESEPVAWVAVHDTVQGPYEFHGMALLPKGRHYLYTAPPKSAWVGLTDEEIGALTVFDGLHHVEVPLLADFARAIEFKLREKNT